MLGIFIWAAGFEPILKLGFEGQKKKWAAFPPVFQCVLGVVGARGKLVLLLMQDGHTSPLVSSLS